MPNADEYGGFGMEALRRALTELTAALEAEGKAKLSADNAMANYSDGGRREVAAYEAALLRVVEAMRLARAALSEGQAPEPSEHERLLAGALMAVLQRVGVLVSSHGATGPELILAAETFCAAKQAPEPVAQEPYGWFRHGLDGHFTSCSPNTDGAFPLYTHPAGMDAARAKAIEACAAVVDTEAGKVLRLVQQARQEMRPDNNLAVQVSALDDCARRIRALATKGAVS